MKNNKNQETSDLFGEAAPAIRKSIPRTKAITPIKRRLIETVDLGGSRGADRPDLGYMHTVLCQTCMPYRSPGPEVRLWERRNKGAVLEMEAGRAFNPQTDKFVNVALPWGPKARLVLLHLNAEALRIGSPIVPVEDSMTAFMRAVLKFEPNGRDFGRMKEQLACLSTTTIRLALKTSESQARQIDTKIVSSFDIWFQKNEKQRVLWPSQIQFSNEYWQSLVEHAVPLDMTHVQALAHSAMALDIYAWLTQRLHRIRPEEPVLVTWEALQGQFGQSFGRLVDFRRKFREALRQVLAAYRHAQVGEEIDSRGTSLGLGLEHSRPPVLKTKPRPTKRG